MGPDAIVWLIVGMGIGFGASLVLLVAYAGLEQRRLGRRLRRARSEALVRKADAPVQSPAAPVTPAVAVPVSVKEPEAIEEPEVVEEPMVVVATAAAMPAAPAIEIGELRPEAAAENAEPVAGEPTPVEREEAEERASETPDIDTPGVAPVVESVVAHRPEVPLVQVTQEAPADRPSSKPMSVEELFAEAFALDRVSVAPLDGDQGDGKR